MVTDSDIKAAIAIEIDKALAKLGAPPAGAASPIELYDIMQAHGAKSDLLSIVGSYADDLMGDAWVIEALRGWNALRL